MSCNGVSVNLKYAALFPMSRTKKMFDSEEVQKNIFKN